MIKSYLHVLFVGLLFPMCRQAGAQSHEVDTARIREVVTRWNEAHNQIDEDAFNDLYASTVLFYANELGKEACVARKLTLLNKQPFAQRLGNDLHLLFYENGVVYCGFTKEVSAGGKTKSYPSYLLLNRFGNAYLITGESDLVTDRNLKFSPALGVQIPIAALQYVSFPRKAPSRSGYWQMVWMVLVVIAGVAIYFFGRKSWRKTVKHEESLPADRKVRESRQSPTTRQNKTIKKEFKLEQTSADSIDLKKGHQFEQYVVNRFRLRSDLFKWMDATSDKGSRDHFPESNKYPDLQYEFRLDGRSYPFSVECKFRSVTSGLITITKDGQIERYKKFAVEKRMEVFIVLGLGGKPEKPEELFVIPIAQVAQEMDKKSLLPFRAYSSFYYNTQQRRLY